MNENAIPADVVGASMVMGAAFYEGTPGPRFTYAIECIGPDGEVKWSETISNLVTTAGKNDLIDKYFKGSAYTINASATVAGAFVSSVNTGTSGILYSAGDFAASRTVASGDTLNVTLTVSIS
jgi:hypothetical protein